MKPRSWFPGGRALLAGVVIWLLLAGVALFYAWQWLPRSALGWTVFVLVSPPALLAMEWLGSKLLRPEQAMSWPGRHEKTRVSRALALLVRVLVLLTIFFGAVIVVGSLLRKT